MIGKTDILICDIDNTILDTGNFLASDHFWLFKKLKIAPKPFLGVIAKVKLLAKERKFIFLSHRAFFLYPISFLHLYLLGFKKFKLIHVNSVKKKVDIIRRFSISSTVYVIDDLSYNHENGDVKFYSEIISEIENIENVKYYNYDWIEKSK